MTDEEILSLRRRIEELERDLAGYDLAARQYKLRAEAAEARLGEKDERIRELEAALRSAHPQVQIPKDAATTSLRARVTELLEQRDGYRKRIAELEAALRPAGLADDAVERAVRAEERVAQLERALATLHATTTKGGSF